ncbi:unnamed protein product [Durusdinium trenchii]|uniref:Uncharacterized protein n=1 Tax=Durusdinium trenchii TaxID=1381693 RepID=A0ABP0J961_9DINO
MARYGEDGYCVFGNFSDCLSECALGRRARDPSYYPSWLTPIYSEILNRSWSTPVTLNFFDGRTVVIRDHYFPADDLYCIAMGWYDLPWATRFAVVKNLTFLEELSEETCEQLSKSIPDYFNISMQDMINETYVSETFMINLEIDSDGTGKIPEWVVKNQYRHAAAKCVLGGNRGALCDIANCAQRGCFGEDKTTLLYTVRGECPSPLSG